MNYIYRLYARINCQDTTRYNISLDTNYFGQERANTIRLIYRYMQRRHPYNFVRNKTSIFLRAFYRQFHHRVLRLPSLQHTPSRAPLRHLYIYSGPCFYYHYVRILHNNCRRLQQNFLPCRHT